MNSKHLTAALLALAGIALLTGCSPPPPLTDAEHETAAVESETPAVDFEAIRAEAQKRYEAKLAAAEQFDRHALLAQMVEEKMHLDLDELPAEPPSLEQVEAAVTATAERETELRFPAAKREQIVEEAKREYPLYEVGSEVTVASKLGGRTFSGRVTALGDTWVKIGSAQILLSDIFKPDPACFNAEKCQLRRDFHVRTQFDIGKSDFLKAKIMEVRPKVYRENAYLNYKGEWVPAQTLIAALFEPECDKQEKAFNEKLQSQLRAQVEAELRDEGIWVDPPLAEETPE